VTTANTGWTKAAPPADESVAGASGGTSKLACDACGPHAAARVCGPVPSIVELSKFAQTISAESRAALGRQLPPGALAQDGSVVLANAQHSVIEPGIYAVPSLKVVNAATLSVSKGHAIFIVAGHSRAPW
jgi:hypothetical protein